MENSIIILEPKFIYFDLDDTLLDHKGAEQAGLIDLYNQFELFNSSDPESLIETYSRINSVLWGKYGKGHIDRNTLQRRRFEETLEELGLDSSVHEEIGNFYMQAYRSHWEWKNGAAEALESISDRFEVGILTNGFAETQKLKIEQFDLADVARHLVISEETGFLKPQPEIFEHATALTEHKADEILYIGDSYTSDVIGGSAFGWKVAWYTDGKQVEGKKKNDADFVFSDFEELIKQLKI